ncbi:MAG: DNA repair protein RadA [Candidatus Glassbacteria bacterium]
MPRPRTVFECTSCAAAFPKWQGRCTNCGAWDSLVEKTIYPQAEVAARAMSHRIQPRDLNGPVPLAEVLEGGVEVARIRSGIGELDGILGGGLVPGSLVLIGGDPGIGKSTLMLQLAGSLSKSGVKVLYLSGEESASQIGMRAARLGIEGGESLSLFTETCFETVEQALTRDRPELLIVDSIQTVYVSSVDSIPGSLAQVRESSAGFMRLAKTEGLTVILVGHVTKDGSIAGPRVLEHMVDTVLYFEGDGNQTHRILRVVKNRFGATNEIGLFQMRGDGLHEVGDLSGYFLQGRSPEASGSAVICTLEGTRPLLVEVQALVTPAGYGTAQRVSTGYDARRLAIMLAILEKRLGLPLAANDVFVNIAGGLRVVEPAADLGVCLGIFSALRDRPLEASTVFVGEVGLSGELRQVNRLETRLSECAKLGFRRVVCPAADLREMKLPRGLEVSTCGRLAQAVAAAVNTAGEGT